MLTDNNNRLIKEWEAMLTYVSGSYSGTIKSLAQTNKIEYNRCVRMNKTLNKKGNKVAYAQAMIDKYKKIVNKVAIDATTDATTDATENLSSSTITPSIFLSKPSPVEEVSVAAVIDVETDDSSSPSPPFLSPSSPPSSPSSPSPSPPSPSSPSSPPPSPPPSPPSSPPSLSYILTAEKNIIYKEDPIEYISKNEFESYRGNINATLNSLIEAQRYSDTIADILIFSISIIGVVGCYLCLKTSMRQ